MSKNNRKNKKSQGVMTLWTEKKEKAGLFLKYIKPWLLKAEKHKRISAVMTCGGLVEFVKGIKDNGEEKRRKIGGYFCGSRFCPVCAWNKAKKDALILKTEIDYIKAQCGYAFIHIVLTVPNVTGDELAATIQKLNLGFKNLLKRKELLIINKGALRKLEVTYDGEPIITKAMYFNSKRTDYYKRRGLRPGDANPNFNTYHPHLHILMAVEPSYFSSTHYIANKRTRDDKKPTWLSLWRDVMRDNTITQTYVKRLYNKTDDAVCEIAKYIGKESNYLHSQEVFDVFYNTLNGAQMLTRNGIFKTTAKMYKDGGLDVYKPQDETKYTEYILSEWASNKYDDVHTRALTAEELSKGIITPMYGHGKEIQFTAPVGLDEDGEVD